MDELFSRRPGDTPPQNGAHGSDLADQPAGHRGGPSRRTVVLSGLLAVIAGAGGGVAAAFGRPRRLPVRRSGPPAALADAIAAERRLLSHAARLEPADPALAAQLRKDHTAHARALEAVIRQTTGTVVPSPTRSASARAAVPRPQLRAEEAAAARRAAAAAASLHGPAAALLASIAACEAGHAELLA